jgi:hypothetical protein
MHSAGVSGDIDEFPIIPSGVTVTNNGTFTKTDLGNNKSVVNFDGSTNYISLADDDAWYWGTGDFTFAYWINPQAMNGRLWYQETTRACPFYIMHYSNKLHVYLSYDGTNWGLNNFTSSATLSNGTWYHITILRSGTTLYYYINGLYDNSVSISTNTLYNEPSPVIIGRENNANGNYLCGNIKDLIIWKGRALTQAEIKLLMNRTHPETGAGLMPINGEYWRLS